MISAQQERLYFVWKEMKRRCYTTHSKDYKSYGAKGIGMCARWLNFENFYSDWKHLPIGMTIDRINNAKGYSRGNCRIATRREQTLNRAATKWIKYHGRKLCVADWERELGFGKSCISQRLRAGWSIERAFTTPSQRAKS